MSATRALIASIDEDVRAALRAHRQPPMPASMLAAPVHGMCRWCGHPTDTRKRIWHEACVVEYRIAQGQLSLAIPDIIARDGDQCWRCKDPPELIPARGFRYMGEVYIHEPEDFSIVAHASRVAPLALFEVDHEIPLWKARDAPEAGRLWYWLLPNLRLLCWRCHASKTKAESKERAHTRRLEQRRAPTPVLTF